MMEGKTNAEVRPQRMQRSNCFDQRLRRVLHCMMRVIQWKMDILTLCFCAFSVCCGSKKLAFLRRAPVQVWLICRSWSGVSWEIPLGIVGLLGFGGVVGIFILLCWVGEHASYRSAWRLAMESGSRGLEGMDCAFYSGDLWWIRLWIVWSSVVYFLQGWGCRICFQNIRIKIEGRENGKMWFIVIGVQDMEMYRKIWRIYLVFKYDSKQKR